jgi:hypothetical protein
VTVGETFKIGLAVGRIGGQTAFGKGFRIGGAGGVDRAHEFEDFPQGDAELHEVRR